MLFASEGENVSLRPSRQNHPTEKGVHVQRDQEPGPFRFQEHIIK